MISYLWIGPAVFAGVLLGILIVALISANGRDE